MVCRDHPFAVAVHGHPSADLPLESLLVYEDTNQVGPGNSPNGLILKKSFFFITCACLFCLYVSMHHIHAAPEAGHQSAVELDYVMIVICNLGVGNKIWGFCKSSKNS